MKESLFLHGILFHEVVIYACKVSKLAEAEPKTILPLQPLISLGCIYSIQQKEVYILELSIATTSTCGVWYV